MRKIINPIQNLTFTLLLQPFKIKKIYLDFFTKLKKHEEYKLLLITSFIILLILITLIIPDLSKYPILLGLMIFSTLLFIIVMTGIYDKYIESKNNAHSINPKLDNLLKKHTKNESPEKKHLEDKILNLEKVLTDLTAKEEKITLNNPFKEYHLNKIFSSMKNEGLITFNINKLINVLLGIKNEKQNFTKNDIELVCYTLGVLARENFIEDRASLQARIIISHQIDENLKFDTLRKKIRAQNLKNKKVKLKINDYIDKIKERQEENKLK